MAALLDTMSSGEDFVSKFRGMLYGPSGVGKTVLGMQLAKKLLSGSGKVLFIDTAQGFATLQLNDKWRHLITNTTRMQYKNLDQLKAVAKAIQNGAPNFTDYEVIVLDEGSSVAEQDLIQVSKYRTAQDPDRKEENENTWPDRNIMYNRYRDMYYTLSACDVHIITLSHEVKDDKLNLTRPSFGPKLYASIVEKMHVVGRVIASESNGQYKRTVQVKPTRTIVAKTRLDDLNGLDTEISFDDLIDAVSRFNRGGSATVDDSFATVGITVN